LLAPMKIRPTGMMRKRSASERRRARSRVRSRYCPYAYLVRRRHFARCGPPPFRALEVWVSNPERLIQNASHRSRPECSMRVPQRSRSGREDSLPAETDWTGSQLHPLLRRRLTDDPPLAASYGRTLGLAPDDVAKTMPDWINGT
jgi:hypothetical protein